MCGQERVVRALDLSLIILTAILVRERPPRHYEMYMVKSNNSFDPRWFTLRSQSTYRMSTPTEFQYAKEQPPSELETSTERWMKGLLHSMQQEILFILLLITTIYYYILHTTQQRIGFNFIILTIATQLYLLLPNYTYYYILHTTTTLQYLLYILITKVQLQMEEGKKQIAASYGQMQQCFHEKQQPILQIRLKNEQLQKGSRLFDERRANERLIAIQQQAVGANKKNTALQIKWSQLKQYEECESLWKSIQEQKTAFKGIIAGKDKLIDQFWEELKKKDDQYSKTLKQEAQDIKALVGRMREQYFAMRARSLRELEEVQSKFDTERRAYIEKAKSEVDECFKKHINMEQSFVESRRKAEEQFQKTIEKLRVEGMQQYANTKVKMENDIQNLEKCYEEMKALYQENTQKLDYNLKVLKEKKEQNTSTYEELKKKQRILNFKLQHLRKQYDRIDQKFKDENKLLTAQYKRITRQFKELQRKFKHFQKADLEKYNEIQAMNEHEVQQLKDKILKCDQVIHSQQLGVEWVGMPNEDQPQEKPIFHEEEQELALVVSQQKLATLIDILIQEGDFIFDDKMREELQNAVHQEKVKEKLQILKKTLSIDSAEELNMFIEEIANHCKYVSEKEKHLMKEEKLKKEQEAREEEEKANRRVRRKVQEKKEPEVEVEQRVDLQSDFQVDRVLVVDFLVQWMSKRDERKKILERTTKRSLKQMSEREKKDLIAKEGKKYWEKMTQVLPQRTFRVWRVLEKSFVKYHDLLNGRQSLLKDAADLHTQNQQLKNLLHQYLQIDHQLIIPPTRLMEKQS